MSYNLPPPIAKLLSIYLKNHPTRYMSDVDPQKTVERIAETYNTEIYGVYEPNGTLVIEQEELEDRRFALLAAMLFDQYSSQFDRIQMETPDPRAARTVSRNDVQEIIDHFVQLVGTADDFKD